MMFWFVADSIFCMVDMHDPVLYLLEAPLTGVVPNTPKCNVVVTFSPGVPYFAFASARHAISRMFTS